MNKIRIIGLFTLLNISLFSHTKAVVFDYGGVLAIRDRQVITDFLSTSFNLNEIEIEKAREAKRLSRQDDCNFWTNFALQRGVDLPPNWCESYEEAVRISLGISSQMYSLVERLKNKNIKVVLFTNIQKKWAHIAKSYGAFDPFDICIFSYDVGIEKPDDRIYKILLKKIAIPSNEVFFVDDKHENIEAAKKHGIDAVVFKSFEHVVSELQNRNVL